MRRNVYRFDLWLHNGESNKPLYWGNRYGKRDDRKKQPFRPFVSWYLDEKKQKIHEDELLDEL